MRISKIVLSDAGSITAKAVVTRPVTTEIRTTEVVAMKTANRIKPKVAALVVATIGFAMFVGFSAGTANAADSPQDTVVTSTTVNISDPTVTVGGVTVTASDVASGKVTILANIRANGMPHRLVKKLKAEGKCRWIGKGTKVPVFTNSGATGGAGKYGKFKDTRRTFVCHTGIGPSGWQKVFDINPTTGQKEHFCDNYVWFKLLHNLITGRIIMVRSFERVMVEVHAFVYVSVTAPCGDATATASAGADASASISLRVLIRAHGSISSGVFASIVANLQTEATASIVCNAPPPSHASPTITCTTLNDLDAGGSSGNYKCQVTCPGTESCKLTLSSAYGHFDPADPAYFSGDPDPFSYTYYAPSEVPPGGQDTITAIAYDLDTGTSAQWIQSFDINPPPPSS